MRGVNITNVGICREGLAITPNACASLHARWLERAACIHLAVSGLRIPESYEQRVHG